MKINLRYSIYHSQILQRDEFETAPLETHFDSERPAWIYCIMAKNRVTINPRHIDFNDKYIETEFLIQVEDKIVSEKIKFSHPYEDLEELKIKSKFPHNKFNVIDEHESPLIGGKSAYILEQSICYDQVKQKELLDYEILYIGQSVLSENKVPVLDRIKSHETYQKILEEFHSNHPDKELFLMFLSFKHDGIIDIPEGETESDRRFFMKNFNQNYFDSSLLEVRQNVSLLEATLINFFKPKYNQQFSRNQPGKKHSTFRTISKMNLNTVKILFGLENFAPRFYTSKVSRHSEYLIDLEFN